MMKYGSSHERQYVFSSTAEEDLFEESLKVSLVVHPDP
jgi:hypothetical protein